ncbi:MAG TPA: NAD-dependent epimerase/dehydratase family protein [Polyangiaceae bacterium]|nr:NAD-dependent epimerase/dehydratase family protein [Polyangiaceae bacterium]
MSQLTGASCLITGGAGYIGAGLLRELAQVAGRVRRFGRSECRPPLPKGQRAALEDMVGDVGNRADIGRAIADVDYIFHLAAQTSVYVAEADPLRDQEVNLRSMLQLLEACRASGRCQTVIFSSTSTVVGLPQCWPVDESPREAPITTYDVHKLMAEQYLEYYVRRGFIRGTSLRLSNVYGPGPRSSKPERGVLNTMIRRALAGEPLKIFGHGDFVRDYVYVGDVARAFTSAAERSEAVNGQHFLLGSGKGFTLRAAVERVAEIVGAELGKPVLVEHVEPPATLSAIETRNFVADIGAVRKALGWEPRVSLDEGIRLTMAATLLEHESA